MAKFLDITGLQTLWDKIKSNFAPLNKSFKLHNPATSDSTYIQFSFNSTYSAGLMCHIPTSTLSLSPSGVEVYNKSESYREMFLEPTQLIFNKDSNMMAYSLMTPNEFLLTDSRGNDVVRMYSETGTKKGLFVNYDTGAAYRLKMDGVSYFINPTKLQELGLLVKVKEG